VGGQRSKAAAIRGTRPRGSGIGSAKGRRQPLSVVKWCQPFFVRLDFEPFPTTTEHRLDIVGAYGRVGIPMLLEEGLMIDALIWYTVWVLIVSSMVAMLIGPVG
jgi:hypothetical protein